MPTAADRERVLRLLADEDGQIAEVLPREEYDEEHIDGAIHLPLKGLTSDAAAVLDAGRPVIVYCWDSL